MNTYRAEQIGSGLIAQRASRRQVVGGLVGLALGGLLGVRHRALAAQEATPGAEAAETGYPEFKMQATDGAFELPATIPAGRYRVTLENSAGAGVDAFLMRLPEGVTMEDVDAVFAAPPEVLPAWWLDATFAGGPTVQAGKTGQTIADFGPGDWLVLGNGHPTRPFTVTGDAATPVAPAIDPPAAASVELQEYAFVGLDGIAAGEQTWKITNVGTQPHFLELIKVPTGTTTQQIIDLLMRDDAATPAPGELDPATIAGVGGIGALSAGNTGWYLPDLEPATYAALCFVLDVETGLPHAMMGMVQVFTVA